MAIMGFTGFNDLSAFAATTTVGRIQAYMNFKMGVAPTSNAYFVGIQKAGTSSWLKNEYGLGMTTGGTATDYGVFALPLNGVVLGSQSQSGATLTFGFRVRSVTGVNPNLLLYTANSVAATSASANLFASYTPPSASTGNSFYVEIQVKRVTETTIAIRYRANGGTIQNATLSNPSLVGILCVGFSGYQTGAIATGAGHSFSDMYVAYNEEGADEWLGSVTVGKSTPINTTDIGSLQPANISTAAQNFIKGAGAAVSYTGTAATSDSNDEAKSALLSNKPWVMVQDPTSPINSSGIQVLGVNMTTWGMGVDATAGANVTSTIKNSEGTVLRNSAVINNNTTLFVGPTATIDVSAGDIDVPSLVFEASNS